MAILVLSHSVLYSVQCTVHISIHSTWCPLYNGIDSSLHCSVQFNKNYLVFNTIYIRQELRWFSNNKSVQLAFMTFVNTIVHSTVHSVGCSTVYSDV